MKAYGIVVMTVLAVVVESQLGIPSCIGSIPEETQFYLNRQFSKNTTYTMKKILLPSIYTNFQRIDRKLPVKIIVHGWKDNAFNPLYNQLIEAYLEKEDLNLIRVDYRQLAAEDYPIVLAKVPVVVCDVADFINGLMRYVGISLSNVHFIGDSIGAQICGLIAKNIFATIGEKIGRITVLDGARDGFESILVDDSKKLTKDDATRVDAIHTDAGEIGLEAPVGHADFYPNGGRQLQPNCIPTKQQNLVGFPEANGDKRPANVTVSLCSHLRAIQYYTKSVNNVIKATKCDSWTDFQDGNCAENQKVTFGENLEEDAEGVFYLDLVIND